MKRSFYRRMVSRAAIIAIAMSACFSFEANSVIFPQPKQPGTPWAKSVADKNHSEYVLGNDLFSAKFVCTGGKLTFAGCEAMGLGASDNLFTIELDGGKRFTSSDMHLEMVTTRPLTPVKGTRRFSEHYSGKAVSAKFVKDGITVNWQAVLRDDSHYLRTEMTISTDADINMKGITAMNFNVKCTDESQMPKVVGNTRGAVIASSHIFAGLETPMGVNSVNKGKKRGEVAISGYWHRRDVLTPD